MVLREPQDIEIIPGRDDRDLLSIVAKIRAGKLALDELPCDCKRVVVVMVQPAANVGQDRIRNVCPVVRLVRFLFNRNSAPMFILSLLFRPNRTNSSLWVL